MDEFEIRGILGPHDGAQVLLRAPKKPSQALILLHGRGSSGAKILNVTHHLDIPDDVLIFAPTAIGNTWYPHRFLVPKKDNEPHLSSALSAISFLIEKCNNVHYVPPQKIVLAGFSQGACLISQFAATYEGRLKGLCVWSGGLIGSDADLDSTKLGNLQETPTFIGCDENDAHIPRERVEFTAQALTQAKAKVTLEIYRGLGHAVHANEYGFLEQLLHT